MKKGMTKKSLNKFTSRNTHKRRDKEKRRAELLRIIESIDVRHDGFTMRDSVDSGYRGRVRDDRAPALKHY